jgi:ketosteroid isomerase-like protein
VLAGQVPALSSQAAASLLEADRAAAKRSEECGFACGLGSALGEGAYYLHNGMPVIHGAAAARAFLQAQDTLLSHRVQWQPLDGRVSADGTFGITWGVTTVALRGGPVRFGRYITAWQRDAGGWRIAAHLQTALNTAAQVHRPEGWVPPALPALPSALAVAPFIEADRSFAAQGGREGAAAAFAAWAAPDAVVFGPSELVRGPSAIGEYFTGPPSQWTWGPVGAGGSADGTLGFTVGEATIRQNLPDGREATIRSKYLTIWAKQADGGVRYLVDGGNSR